MAPQRFAVLNRYSIFVVPVRLRELVDGAAAGSPPETIAELPYSTGMITFRIFKAEPSPVAGTAARFVRMITVLSAFGSWTITVEYPGIWPSCPMSHGPNRAMPIPYPAAFGLAGFVATM